MGAGAGAVGWGQRGRETRVLGAGWPGQLLLGLLFTERRVPGSRLSRLSSQLHCVITVTGYTGREVRLAVARGPPAGLGDRLATLSTLLLSRTGGDNPSQSDEAIHSRRNCNCWIPWCCLQRHVAEASWPRAGSSRCPACLSRVFTGPIPPPAAGQLVYSWVSINS